MLRRPPTTIGITAEDIALFESQYAQGHIYRSHHYPESQHTNSNAQNSQNSQNGNPNQRLDPNMPAASEDDEADDDAASMIANPGVPSTSAGQMHASGNRNSGQRRIRTREQRIHGSVVAAAAAAASASATATAAAAIAAPGYTVTGGVIGGVSGGGGAGGDASGGATRVAGPAQEVHFQYPYQQR
jgi:phage protein D